LFDKQSGEKNDEKKEKRREKSTKLGKESTFFSIGEVANCLSQITVSQFYRGRGYASSINMEKIYEISFILYI